MDSAPRDGTPFLAAMLVLHHGPPMRHEWQRYVIIVDEDGEPCHECGDPLGWSLVEFDLWTEVVDAPPLPLESPR